MGLVRVLHLANRADLATLNSRSEVLGCMVFLLRRSNLRPRRRLTHRKMHRSVKRYRNRSFSRIARSTKRKPMLSLRSSARCSRNIPQIGMCRGSTPPRRDWRLWWLEQATLRSDEASVLKALGDRDGPDEYAVCRRRRRGTCVRCPGRAGR